MIRPAERRLAQLEESLTDDHVLSNVSDLFTEPVMPLSTTPSANRVSRPSTHHRSLAALLLTMLMVMTGVTCAVAISVLSPLIAAMAITLAAGVGTISVVRSLDGDKNSPAPTEGGRPRRGRNN
jgi:hypothetical protein